MYTTNLETARREKNALFGNKPILRIFNVGRRIVGNKIMNLVDYACKLPKRAFHPPTCHPPGPGMIY